MGTMADRKDGKATGKARLGRTVERPNWIVLFSIGVRAVHQVGAAVFLASFLLGQIALPLVYLAIAAVSGVLLLITEGMRHRQLFREVSGISTLVKLIMLGLAYHGWVPATTAVFIAFVSASIFSHAPKHIRHRLLL
jgi:hypothetical protein